MLAVSDALKVVSGKHEKFFDARAVEVKGQDGKVQVCKFIKVAKSNDLKPIIFPDNTERSPFMKTSLLDRIIAERDEEFRRQVGAKQSKGQYNVWRYTKENQAKALVIEDSVHFIQLHTVGDVEGDKVPVLLTKPGTPLWLCSDSLAYLKLALNAEHAIGHVCRAKLSGNDDSLNIEGALKLVTARGTFLRVRCTADDGRPKNGSWK